MAREQTNIMISCTFISIMSHLLSDNVTFCNECSTAYSSAKVQRNLCGNIENLIKTKNPNYALPLFSVERYYVLM